MTQLSRLHRRQFLTRGALTAGALAIAAPFDALLARGPQHVRRGRGPSPDYGPLQPALDETTGLPLLKLPADFRYLSFGWTGEVMHDGIATPPVHDGMAAFPGGHGRVYLIHLPLRAKHRRPAHHTRARLQPELQRLRVRRRVLQPRRQMAVLQYPVAGNHLRGHGSVG